MVVGGTRGIGLACVKVLKARGYEVIVGCRKGNDALVELGVTIVEGVDLETGSIEPLVRATEGKTIDILLCNAGLACLENFKALNIDSIERQMTVNATGQLRTAVSLISKMKYGSKIVFTSTLLASFAMNQDTMGFYGYRMSKAALNMAGKCLANDLKPRGISVAMVHPGVVPTDMMQALMGQGMVPPPELMAQIITTEQSAEGMVNVIDNMSLGKTGEFLSYTGAVLPW